MSFILNTISSKRALALGALLLLAPVAVGALGYVYRGSEGPSASKTFASAGTAFATMTAQTNSTPLDAEHITLRRTGFEPNEFTRPAGRFLLAIDNLSEMGEMRFRLVRQNGLRERDLPPKNNKFRLRQVVDLRPGRYDLVIVGHPEWVCHITIASP